VSIEQKTEQKTDERPTFNVQHPTFNLRLRSDLDKSMNIALAIEKYHPIMIAFWFSVFIKNRYHPPIGC
jgi:hypothetical protein